MIIPRHFHAGLVLGTCMGMRYWALSILLCTHTLKCRFVLFTGAFAQLERSAICSYGTVDVEQSYRLWKDTGVYLCIFMTPTMLHSQPQDSSRIRSESKMEIEPRTMLGNESAPAYCIVYKRKYILICIFIQFSNNLYIH